MEPVARVPRLSNGSNPCSGRVEVFHKEKWASMCDAAFDWQDAKVVCRELDCGAPVEVLGAAAFGDGEGQVWSEEIKCGGNETQIQLCPTSPMNNNCSHENNIGLICRGTNKILASWLVNGSSRCSGRVEVLHRGQWGTVCDNGWDLRDAAVVCRELGCGEAIEALKGAQFEQGSGGIWMSDVECVGYESTVKNCNAQRWGAENCSHHQDAGVICSGVQLVGHSYCSGRVELLHKDTKHTVCSTTFDQQDAEVVCRQLDCGAPVEVLGAAAFGEGEGQVWSEEIQCGGNETQIQLCPTSSLKLNCSHENDIGLICRAAVRLVNGSSRCSGRVEVLHRGQWGTVCDNGWDLRDAAVVCRELGCGEAVEALKGAQFEQGSGGIWMSDVECMGSESTLKDCNAQRWGAENCSHHHDAGVICSGVQLVSRSHCSGRVELLHKETRHTVCSITFDQQDAEVVCRQLGCGAPVEVLGAAAFGEGEGQMWSEEIQCGGNETQIQLCPTSPTPSYNCSHKHDVGLVCNDYYVVRLANGGSRCSGRVEVYHAGEWGTVCDDSWDMTDAAVVCRELGCGDAVDALGGAHFGEGSGTMWMDEVSCEGSESTLKNCGHQGWGSSNCGHDEDAGVICSGRVPRLSNGSNPCSGRVEVFHKEKWASMCYAAFDWQDAKVVCRELDCGAPVEVLGAAAFGEGEGQVWSEEIQCGGNETQIQLCPTSLMNNNCSHENNIGLICRAAVRLVNGSSRCSGRVEVLHRGQWGTVCDNGWDLRDAAVVCRELGCGEALEAIKGAQFEQGSGGIWMSEVECVGSESTVKNCNAQRWGAENCGHHQDAGVICSGVQLVGHSYCSGRVELLHKDTKHTVCSTTFDQQDAEVVCRQLDCGAPVVVLGAAAFGEGEGQVWSEEIQCEGNETQIQLCPTSSLKLNCSHENDIGLICRGTNTPYLRILNTLPSTYKIPLAAVRLVNGSSRCSGRVEVPHRGQWGTVCDNGWDLHDAAVVCRELGCGEAVEALKGAQFEQGSGGIWMSDVECMGSESTLKDCMPQRWGAENCSHHQDAGVICSGVQLVGRSHCSGRVELLHKETRHTVCSTTFDQQDAEVVCRQLGCGAPVEVLGAAAFGEGEGQVWSEEIQCGDVVRLANGGSRCSGRVEVYHAGEWGTVCDDSWDMTDAAVVCRELDCGDAVQVLGSAHFGEGSGTMWMDEVSCEGSESTLKNCGHQGWGSSDCSIVVLRATTAQQPHMVHVVMDHGCPTVHVVIGCPGTPASSSKRSLADSSGLRTVVVTMGPISKGLQSHLIPNSPSNIT
ncbi:scavenger receptor cysteine-rich domain-containing protein DMBT1-like [Alosa pseudoharengus]|uniref:scavenger receptor cysteine-rich domain-containing protein DMBT1-like n=1 Tax=Alosa pseudoharengus TaxID=34774 RepID=UPI003F88E821